MTLHEWLIASQKTNKWLSQTLPACPISVSRWRCHKTLPRRATMRRIEELSGGAVQPADWFRPAPIRQPGFSKGMRRARSTAEAVS